MSSGSVARQLEIEDIGRSGSVPNGFSPDVRIEAQIVLFDSNDSFCTTTCNRLLYITDIQVAAVANSDMIIAGYRERVTRKMAFKEEWLRTHDTNPLAALGDVVEDIRRRGYSRPQQAELNEPLVPSPPPVKRTDSAALSTS
jgi:hypothetical protein